jgi:hypothetical protein
MADPSLIAKPKMEYASRFKEGGSAKKGLGILTFVAFLFLVIVGIAYGGVHYYKQNAINALDGLTRELSQLEEDLDPEIIEEITRVDRGLTTARALLARHVYTSNVFDILEQNTVEDIYFSAFNLTYSAGGVANLTGIAPGYVLLHRQLEQFRSVPLIRDVTLESIQLMDENDIGFAITISFAENLFRFR